MKTIKFIGTCSDPIISSIAEKPGRKSSYKNACRIIKEQYPSLYYNIALEFPNPWDYETNIKTINNQKYLHIIHSMVDYIFKILE